jgi:hypothetical protein
MLLPGHHAQAGVQMVSPHLQDQLHCGHFRLPHHDGHLPWVQPNLQREALGLDGHRAAVHVLRALLRRDGEVRRQIAFWDNVDSARDFAEICTEKMAANIGYYKQEGIPERHLETDICAGLKRQKWVESRSNPIHPSQTTE